MESFGKYCLHFSQIHSTFPTFSVACGQAQLSSADKIFPKFAQVGLLAGYPLRDMTDWLTD